MHQQIRVILETRQEFWWDSMNLRVMIGCLNIDPPFAAAVIVGE